MANTAQARKCAHQAVVRNTHNSALRSRLRTVIKDVRKVVVVGNKITAATTFKTAQSMIDSIADKKIVRKNKVTRAESHLSTAIKVMVA